MNKDHIRSSHEHRKDLAGEYRWGDTGQFIFIIIFITGMTSDLFLLKISNSLQDAIPWFYRVVIFLPLFFVAVYFSQRSHEIVFKEERKELMVIKNDVFSKVRHPMYLGFIFMYLSFVVLSFSVVAFLIFIFVVIFYYYLCWYEEKILLERLGDEYKNYMKTVPMLIPKISK